MVPSLKNGSKAENLANQQGPPLRTGEQVSISINFINILRAVFMRADYKSAKKIDNLTVFVALSGSAQVKAARRTLTLGNSGLLNVYHKDFVYNSLSY